MTQAFLFVVAAALFDVEGRILLAKRPQGKNMAGLFEFPGGKVQDAEKPEEALSRELREELALDMPPQAWRPLTFASHPYDAFHLFMPLYGAHAPSAPPRPLEGQELVWSFPQDLSRYPMPPADKPLAAFLNRLNDMNSYLDATR